MTHRSQHLLTAPLLDAKGLDLVSAERVVYVLRQSFRYDYDGPAYGLQQRLVVVPAARHGNARRLTHRLTVTDTDAPSTPSETLVTTHRPRSGVVVARARLPVVTQSVTFSVEAAVERRGPWQDHELPWAAAADPQWLRPTRLTTADDAIRGMAHQLRGLRPRDAAVTACHLVHEAMPYEYGLTGTRTTAAEALALGRGVCQDHAHVMVATCRAAGIAARYVSGHLLGEGATHAWVEVLVAEDGVTRAVALDPCNDCPADARYLTVATGRDYADVAPASGSYDGGAIGRLTTTQQVGIAEAA